MNEVSVITRIAHSAYHVKPGEQNVATGKENFDICKNDKEIKELRNSKITIAKEFEPHIVWLSNFLS